MSVGWPITGSGSSLKSPVWTIRPSSVSISSIAGSGIECVTGRKETRNGPASTGLSQSATRTISGA